MDINFYASIATIISVFLALYVFLSDRCSQEMKERQGYVNRLTSLNFELQKNNNVILSFFKRDKEAFLNAKKVAYYRYSTTVANTLVAEGTILNMVLLRNLDAITDNENQVNGILDIIILMSETSHINSAEEKLLFENRIKTSYAKIMELNGEIEKYMPKVISDLASHIEETSLKKIHWFCINKCNSGKLSSGMFK